MLGHGRRLRRVRRLLGLRAAVHSNQPEAVPAARHQLVQPIGHAELLTQQTECLIGYGYALLKQRSHRRRDRLGKHANGTSADVEELDDVKEGALGLLVRLLSIESCECTRCCCCWARAVEAEDEDEEVVEALDAVCPLGGRTGDFGTPDARGPDFDLPPPPPLPPLPPSPPLLSPPLVALAE